MNLEIEQLDTMETPLISEDFLEGLGWGVATAGVLIGIVAVT